MSASTSSRPLSLSGDDLNSWACPPIEDTKKETIWQVSLEECKLSRHDPRCRLTTVGNQRLHLLQPDIEVAIYPAGGNMHPACIAYMTLEHWTKENQDTFNNLTDEERYNTGLRFARDKEGYTTRISIRKSFSTGSTICTGMEVVTRGRTINHEILTDYVLVTMDGSVQKCFDCVSKWLKDNIGGGQGASASSSLTNSKLAHGGGKKKGKK